MIELEVPGKSFKEFIQTKEYKRFKEFADSVDEYRYIGICHGESGVGKSLTASYYAKWDDKITHEDAVSPISREINDKISICKAVLVTAPVTNTPKIINQNIMIRLNGFGFAFNKSLGKTDILEIVNNAFRLCSLVIIDEADRLTISSLEEVRNLYDQYQFGLILIGMPGIEKRFSRYPQLYSRLGFSHEFKKLSEDEMKFLFPKIWNNYSVNYDSDNFSDVEALNAIIKITAGNFRLIDRLFSQIKRILSINKLDRITKGVVEGARKCLIIGDQE